MHASAAALGISALIAASPLAFDVLRLGGALYLVWIGALALLAFRRGKNESAQISSVSRSSVALAFRRGFVTNVLNPKVVIFYVAFLPQFADPALGHVALQIFILGALHNLTGIIWLGGLALALRPQPEKEEANRGVLRLAEYDCADAEGAASRSL